MQGTISVEQVIDWSRSDSAAGKDGIRFGIYLDFSLAHDRFHYHYGLAQGKAEALLDLLKEHGLTTEVKWPERLAA